MIRSVSFIFAFQLVSILTFSGSALSQCIDYSAMCNRSLCFSILDMPGAGIEPARSLRPNGF